jgi:hypothetical protein
LRLQLVEVATATTALALSWCTALATWAWAAIATWRTAARRATTGTTRAWR